MANRDRHKIDFEKIIASGENPNGPEGFVAQTVNGTSLAWGTGWNANGPNYNDFPQYGDSPYNELPETPVRPAGRSNRTGE